nr:hypothetical protein [Defluviicoccus vanus]
MRPGGTGSGGGSWRSGQGNFAPRIVVGDAAARQVNHIERGKGSQCAVGQAETDRPLIAARVIPDIDVELPLQADHFDIEGSAGFALG